MHSAISRLFERYPDIRSCENDTDAAFQLLNDTFASGGKLLVCGNGGSAADSEHIVGELMKGFMLRREVPATDRSAFTGLFGEVGDYLASHLQRALPAIALVSHSALSTAFINDVAPDMVFAQQVYGYGKPGDAVLGLSTSGNSKNVLHALQVAKARGLRTIGMTGESGGLMREVCNVTIRVPYRSTPEIQERHLPIYHALCIALEDVFFGTM